MLQFKWESTTITTNKQANNCLALFDKTAPTVGAFDTETTGLNIKLDKPFLFQFGWVNFSNNKGYTFVVDIEKQPNLAHQVIKAWHKRAKTLKEYAGHNVKFDLHMMYNIDEPYLEDNLTDTQFYIRYAHDALTPANGGPPLKLKAYAAKYITPEARNHERLLDKEKTDIAKQYNIMLKQRLSMCGTPPPEFEAKSYTLKVIEQMFADKVFNPEDLQEPVKSAYFDWLNLDLPLYLREKVIGKVESNQIPYNKLNRQTVITYGHYDIVLTLEVLCFLKKHVEARQNMSAVVIENKLIKPLFYMESTGFKTNKEYLEQSRQRLKAYILTKREELKQYTTKPIKIGQHEAIKEVLKEEYGLDVASTGSEELELLANSLKVNPDENIQKALKFISTIQLLRTLEKWYSAYIVRFLKDLGNCDRLYTQINQVGTVSGRVTSDFQQFPKKPIKDDNGNELFHPRKVIEVDGGDYNSIIYLDYSQIELRFQALYTILVGHPDINLCRAYMPYECVDENGVEFDYNNPEHIKNWKAKWYYKEDTAKHWIPTDVHGATTKAAFGIDENHPDYHDLRYVGKRVNFAKNYGAQYSKICQMFPDRTPEECRRIDAAYYTAFPGVKEYHNYCYARAKEFSYTENMFGVRYYGLSGHKLINTLVQGSAAFYLKLKIIELFEYMQKNNLKSKLQMQIHDELSWCVYKGEESEFFKLKEIMETWSDSLVPIVADMEITHTNWAEKFEVSTLEELYEK